MQTPAAEMPHMGISVHTSEGILYTVGANVYRRDGSQWLKLVDANVGHMWQSASNNIVAVGQSAWHFNGLDWKEFVSLVSFNTWYGCYTDGNEVFIVGNDNSKTIIMHGR